MLHLICLCFQLSECKRVELRACGFLFSPFIFSCRMKKIFILILMASFHHHIISMRHEVHEQQLIAVRCNQANVDQESDDVTRAFQCILVGSDCEIF